MDTDLSFLVTRQESPSTLVRFEDETDANAPRLNYSVPLPGAFQGKLFIETDFLNDQLPWTAAARRGTEQLAAIRAFAANLRAGGVVSVPPIESIAVVPRIRRDREPVPQIGFFMRDPSGQQRMLDAGGAPVGAGPRLARIAATGRTSAENDVALSLRFGELEVDFDQIAAEAELGRVPVIYQRFGGDFDLVFVPVPPGPQEANPRFVIIEHYRLSSLFGDYGAGRTIASFSLMPGEETRIYLRTFRRTEASSKAASSSLSDWGLWIGVGANWGAKIS